MRPSSSKVRFNVSLQLKTLIWTLETQTLTELARWRLFACSETPASQCVSAFCYHFPEHIGIVAMVMTELELRQVERQILAAHVMISSDHATFEQCPERFDAVGMD